MKACRLFFVVLVVVFVSVVSLRAQQRWSAEKANEWYAKQPWLVGANYVPSDAINQFEMFQAATWDPALNDKELEDFFGKSREMPPTGRMQSMLRCFPHVEIGRASCRERVC